MIASSSRLLHERRLLHGASYRELQLQLIRCHGSKTTSSRSTTSSTSTSRSRPGTTSSKPAGTPTPARVSMQEQVDGFKQRISGALDHLTPKQEGDMGDVLLMSLSMAVLIYLSMQLYRLYAYAVFSAGSYQTMRDMMQ